MWLLAQSQCDSQRIAGSPSVPRPERENGMTVPLRFEDYLATKPPGRPDRDGTCAGCGKHEPLTAREHCEACAKYHYGYDQAEEKVLDLTIGAAIHSALEEVPFDTVMAALNRAVERHHMGSPPPCAGPRQLRVRGGGDCPALRLLKEMTKYNEEPPKAGVMLAGDGRNLALSRYR